MKVLFSDKKNFVIGAMGLVILLLGFALVADEGVETISSNSTPNASRPQEKSESEVAGIREEHSEVPGAVSDKQEATLVRVVDGDTIAVSINGKIETVRIIGIDTPEVVDQRRTVECFGKEASAKAKIMFENNKKILLESDPTQGERDKYQRLLRYVWIDGEEVDFGKFMIEEGYAHEYTYNTSYKYQGVYKEAERGARLAKRGLWADDACLDSSGFVEQETTKEPPVKKQLPTNVSSEDKDCSDFSTHTEAQDYFLSKGGSPSNNVDRLDADRDGIACESLP